MSEQKKKIILAIALASIAIILLGGISLSFFPAQQKPSASTPNVAPAPAGGSAGEPAILVIARVLGTVELDSSEGFNSSIIGTGAENSTLFVLPPGGSGSVPFLVYSSDANETVNISLSVDLGSTEADSYGVQFSVSPSNFILSPGQQVTSVLTIAADENAPSAFYLPTVEIQTNSSYIVGGTVNVPALLVANFTPSCLFLENEQEVISPAVPMTPSAGIANASASSPPIATSSPPGLSVAPTINMVPGENATVLFGCLTQDKLSLNVTVPAGFSSEFSPNSLNIIFSYTSGNMYALTVTADPNLGSGTYEVNVTGSLGSYQFDASFYVAVT